MLLSLNCTGPTPTRTRTPTLGMRLSCNFVNVHDSLSCTVHVYTRASLARKIALVGQVGEDPRACSAHAERSYSCCKLNREVAGHADILATILERKSARMSVSVSVSAPWNVSFTRYTYEVPYSRNSGPNTLALTQEFHAVYRQPLVVHDLWHSLHRGLYLVSLLGDADATRCLRTL